MARRGASLLLLALPALVLPAPAPSPAAHAGDVDAGGGAVWAVLPALALLVSLATIIIGCSWCHRYRNCKLFGARRASTRSVEAARAQAEPDGALPPPAAAEGERGPVLLSRGPLPPDNNNVSEDNNNGPISAREMQNIENNNAAVYIISENENRNALSAARGREDAAVRLNASRESVVEFEPLPVDITPQHQHYDDWFAPQYEEFPRSQLQYLREIGRGSFGRIVEGEVESLGGAVGARAVTVKILEQQATRAERARFLRDARLFRDLRHQNILALLARNLSEDPWLLIFDLCSMDLQQYLISNRPKMGVLNERGTPLRLKCDISAGLAYIHSHGFVYGSMWSGGVLVSGAGGEGEVRARLGHYGDARAPRLAPWSAPEVMERPGAAESSSSEVWSLGVVLWEVCSWGELPPAALPTVASPPLLPCPYRDHLYQVMQLCWNVNPERRPTTAQVHALLNHLYTSHLASQHMPHDPHASSDFEDRWQRLKPNSIPKVDEHIAIVHADTHTLSSRFTRSQDDFREETNLLPVDRETVASRSSSIMSDTLPNNKSDSLTNLHGSLEDMRNVNYITSDATVLEGRLEASAERTLCAEPDRASCEDLTEKVDPWLAEVIANGDDVGYYRDVSDVIKNLDSILNSEKTSSSESSHQASPSRENLALQMRDVPPPPSGLVKSPGIADFQNILELPALELQSREEDNCVAGGFLRHSFERNSQKSTPTDEQLEVPSPPPNADNTLKPTPDSELNDVSEKIENEVNVTLPFLKDSCLANSSISSNKFECETKDCRESCDNVNLFKTYEVGESVEIVTDLKPVVECEVKLNSDAVQDTCADLLSASNVAGKLDKLDKEMIDEVEPRGDHSEEAESEKNSISDTEVLSMDNDSTVYMDLKAAPSGLHALDNNNSLNKAVEKDINKLCSNLKTYKRDEVIEVEADVRNDSTRYLELPQVLIDTTAFLHAEKSIALPYFYIYKSEASLSSSGLLDNGNIFTSTPKVEDTIEAINTGCHDSNKNHISTEILMEGSIESTRDFEPRVTITLEKQDLSQDYVFTSTPKDDIQASSECATLNEAFLLTDSTEIPDEKTSELQDRENLSKTENIKKDNLGSPAECNVLNNALTYSKEYSTKENTSQDRDKPSDFSKNYDSQATPVTHHVFNETFQLTDLKEFSPGENTTDSLDTDHSKEPPKKEDFQGTSAECTAFNQSFELTYTSKCNEREEEIPDYGPGVTITRLTQQHAPQDLEIHEEPKPIEDSSVVLGPFENCTLDYFKGIKTETHEPMDSDLPREELMAFSSNFVELNLDSENVRTEQLEGPESLPTDSMEKLPEDRLYDTIKVVSPMTPPNSPGNCLFLSPQHKYLVYEQSLSPTEHSLSPIPTHSMGLERNMLEDRVDLSHIQIQLTTKLAMAENENNLNIEYSGPLSIEELPPPDSLETVGLEDADVDTPPECNECPQEGEAEEHEAGRRNGCWLDEECVRALRNELELKLPLAQASGCEPVDDMPMELPPPPAEAECEGEAGVREEVVVCYPGALSPILEETDPQLTAYHNNLNWTHSQRTDSSESYPEPCNNSTDDITELVTAMRSDPPPADAEPKSDDSGASRTFTVHKEKASNEISMSADSLNGTDDGTLKDVIMPSTSVHIPSQPAVIEPTPQLIQVKSPDTECERLSQISPYLLSPTVDSCKFHTDSNDVASNISKLSRPTLPSELKSSKASDTQCLSKATSIDSWCSNDTLFNVEDNFDELVMDSDAEENAQKSRSSATLTRDDDNGGPTYIVHGSDSDKCDSFTPDSITANYTYTKVRTESPTKSVTKCPENDDKVELEIIKQATSDTSDYKQPVDEVVEIIEKDMSLNASMKDAPSEKHDETDILVNSKAEKSDDVTVNELLLKDLTNSHEFINSNELLNRDVSMNSDDFITKNFSVKKHVDSPIELIRNSSVDYCLNMTPPIYNSTSEKTKDSALNADLPRPVVSKMESVDIACLKEDFLEDSEDHQLKNATINVSEVSPMNGGGSTLSPERHYRGMANSVTSTPLVLEAKDEPEQLESQKLVFKTPQAMHMNVPHFEAFVNSAELRPQDMSPFMRLEGDTHSNIAIPLHNGSKVDHISLNSNGSAKSPQSNELEDKTSGYFKFQSSAQNKFQDLSPVDLNRGTLVCPNVLDGITSSSEFLQSERSTADRSSSYNISEKLPSETVMENGLDHVIEKNKEPLSPAEIIVNNLVCTDTTTKEEIRPECLPQSSIDDPPKGTSETLECEPIIEKINEDEITSSVELSNLIEEIKYPSNTNDESTEGSIENPNITIPSVIIEDHSGDVHTYIPVHEVKSGLEFRNDNCPSFASFENSVQAKPQELSSLTNQNCTDIPNASKSDVEFSSFERSAANKPQDLSSAVKSDCSQSSHNLNETYDSHKSGQTFNETFQTFDSHRTQRKPESFNDGDESDPKDSSPDSSKDQNQDLESNHSPQNNKKNKSNKNNDNSHDYDFDSLRDYINPRKANESHLKSDNLHRNIVQVHIDQTNKKAEDLDTLDDKKTSSTLIQPQEDLGFYENMESKNDSLVSVSEDNPHSDEILDKEISSTASTAESEPTTREMDSLDNHLEIINEEVVIHNEMSPERPSVVVDGSLCGKFITKKVDMVNEQDIVQAIEELDQVIEANGVDADARSASPSSCRSEDGDGQCEEERVVHLDPAEMCSVTDSFIEHEKSFSEINACLPLLRDIRFTGPSCDYMSTSFNQDSPSEDASMMMLESELRKAEENAERLGAASEALKEWESESEDSQTNSTSSGEFIWKRQQNGGGGSELGSIAEGSEGEGEREGDGSDADGSEGDEVEFVPSSWDCRAAPAKSSMKNLEQSPTNDSKKRVVFKRQKYHCVYEYPREIIDECDMSGGGGESRMLHSPYLPDYSAYAGSLWEALSAGGVGDVDLGYGYPTAAPLHLYHLPGDAAFSPNYGLPDEDFFISSSARPFESLGIMSTTSQFFPGLHATLKAVGTLERGDSPDEETDDFPPPPSPLAPVPTVLSSVNTHTPHSGSLDFTTPDSGVEDVTPGCAIDEDPPPSITGEIPPPPPTTERSRLKLRAPEGNTSSSESPSPSSPCWEVLGGLRHTRDRLKLDLPPSPLHLASSGSRHGQRVFNFLAPDASPASREPPSLTPLVMSDETPVARAVPLPLEDDDQLVVPEPTFSTFGKSNARNTSAAPTDVKPLLMDEECNASTEESPAKAENEVIVLRNKSLLEAVKGEGTVLDSGDEDSGIESSAKTTLERNPPHHSAA